MSTATIDQPPARSLEQRQDALRTANRIRIKRADLKRRVAQDWQRAAQALTADDPDLANMKVWDLLIALRRFGRQRVNRLLLVTQVSQSKTIGGLTERQRSALVLAMARHHGGKLVVGSRG